LVTGGTGSLGREVVSRLLNTPYQVRLLGHQTRTEAPSAAQVLRGDLATGTGLHEATAGIDAIIHCASNVSDPQGTDVGGTRALLEAARANGAPLVVFISIVGVDRTTYPYYRAKREAELLIEHAGLPWTIQRATQFHRFVHTLLHSWGADTQSEVSVPANLRVQSIAVEEVADRLVARVEGGPRGYAPDLGGPKILPIEEMTQTYLRLRGRQATIHVTEPANAMLSMMCTGIILTPAHAEGKMTWEQYVQTLAQQGAAASS
jgi:uncharacterized protein YbjT (DUF2867 family)